MCMLLHGRLPVRVGTVNLGRQSRAPIWHLLVPTISYLANTNLPTEPRDARSHSPIWNLKFTYHQPNTELLAARGGALPHAEYVQSRGLSCGCGRCEHQSACGCGRCEQRCGECGPTKRQRGRSFLGPAFLCRCLDYCRAAACTAATVPSQVSASGAANALSAIRAAALRTRPRISPWIACTVWTACP